MTNIINALSLANETVRVIKFEPSIILAFIRGFWRPTFTFVTRNISSCWFSTGNNEGVVNNDRIGCAGVPSAMYSAIHFFKRLTRRERFLATASVLYNQGTTPDNVECIRGGDWQQITWDEELFPGNQQNAALVALDEALDELATIDDRKRKVVELRYFAGLSIEETSEVLAVSPDAVARLDTVFGELRYQDVTAQKSIAATASVTS